jgi:hypothetical protein
MTLLQEAMAINRPWAVLQEQCPMLHYSIQLFNVAKGNDNFQQEKL